MNISPVLPVNRIEIDQSAAHSTRGITQVQVRNTDLGMGLLAMILNHPYTPFEGHISEDIPPKQKSVALKAPPR